MKSYMKPVLIFLIIINSNLLAAQSIEETMQLANNAFSQNKFHTATALYERVLFFDSTYNYSTSVFKKLGIAYQKQSNFKKAIYYYDLAYYAAEETGINPNPLLINKAICAIRLKDFELAYNEALYINTDLEDSITARKQQTLLFAIGNFNSENYDESEKHFQSLCPEVECEKEIINFFDELESINKKSPRKARILSMILPGLGFYYIGEWKKGINSTLLVGGLGSLLIINSIQTGFINSFFNLMPWYQRYFMGGYTKAELIAEKKLEINRVKLLEEILSDFQTKFDVKI